MTVQKRTNIRIKAFSLSTTLDFLTLHKARPVLLAYLFKVEPCMICSVWCIRRLPCRRKHSNI